MSSSPGEVRIIGGLWKRSKLPVANVPGLRPTPDRVRETLFNWLGQDLSGWYCADPFAGTGALGFEAASRGAASVVLAETQAQCVIAMGKSNDRLNASQIKIQRTDGRSLLRQLPLQSQDLVFLDPPYDSALYEQALKYAHACLKPAGFAYLESNKAWSEEALQALAWRKVRYLKAGSVHAHLLQTAA